MAKIPSARSRNISERNAERRSQIWPEISEDAIWDRNRSDGYSTIPRTLNLIASIADDLATKNKRVSSTYIGLWCRVWDAGVVEIINEWEVASESGFSGERRVYTWRDRIKELSKIGLIKVSEGPKGPYQFVLILNPYHVMYELNKQNELQSGRWLALTERSKEIGASDIAEYEAMIDSAKSTAKKKKAKRKRR